MPITFPCPNSKCPSHHESKKLTAKDEQVGRTLSCPACKTSITVPTKAVADWIKMQINVQGKNADFYVLMLLGIRTHRVDAMEWLLKQQPEIDINVAGGGNGETLMHVAASIGHIDSMECLKNNRAKIDVRMKNGHMPIHLAAGEGHLGAVDWLLNQDANLVNAKGERDRTPMHQAAAAGKDYVMRLLKNRGGNVVAKDDDGFQPIHSAAICDQTVSLTCLVNELKVDVDEKDKDGMTSLHIAAEQGNIASIKCLVNDLKSNINATNSEDVTPIFVAAFSSQIESVDCLYTLGAKLTLENGITLKKLADTANLTEVQKWLRANEYVNKLSRQLIALGSKLSEQLVAPGSVLAGQIANSKSPKAPPNVKSAGSDMPDFSRIDDVGIHSIEDAIFGDGPFTAHKMKETLGFLATSIRLGGRYSSISISEKKDDYQKVFDEFSESITKIKEPLKDLQIKYGPDNRLASLIGRCEKCEKEIGKLREEIRNYYPR